MRFALAVLLVGVTAVLGSHRALAQEDEQLLGVPDSVFDARAQPPPFYNTVFDRDHSRMNWTQTLAYSRGGRVAFNGAGSSTTQELLGLQNKTTLGNIYARLDAKVVGGWIVSTQGQFNMSSTSDPRTRNNNRDSKLQLYSQYMLEPSRSMTVFARAYTEFQREQVGREQTVLIRADTLNTPGEVDTLFAQHDSSFTTARQDNIGGSITWAIRPWLNLYSTALAGRRFPTQKNQFRNYVNALSDSGSGYVIDSTQVLEEKGDNSNTFSTLTYTGLRRSVMGVTYRSSSVNESRFDQELRGLERMAFDRTLATGHFDYGPWLRMRLTVDGSLIRNKNGFEKRRSSSSILDGRQLLSTMAYLDPATLASVTFQAIQSHTERQFGQTDLVIDRALAGLFSRKVSSRLAMDGAARVSLHSTQFSDPRNDQDLQQSGGNIGGGYMLAPTCSTTVHFSINRNRTVAIDPRASGNNNTQTLYQMTATMQFVPSKNFSIRQNYLLSSDYKIYDFAESQNFLNRTRRIDTDFADTLLPFAYVRLLHSFLYRDNGNYARLAPGAERTYRVSLETYEQTLRIGCGIKLAPGITLSAIQSLFNQKSQEFVNGSSTLRNRFSLDAGIDVNRTFAWDCGIVGAVRHVGAYDEITSSQKNANEEDYWIAGVSFQKQF